MQIYFLKSYFTVSKKKIRNQNKNERLKENDAVKEKEREKNKVQKVSISDE